LNLILILNPLIIPLENHKNSVSKNSSEFDEISNEHTTTIKASNGYDTNLTLFDSIDEVFWGENMTFSVNFTFTDDEGITWKPITDPSAYCNLTISKIFEEILIKETLIPQANGNFSIVINSSRLSAGYSQEFYIVEVNGFHPIYNNPDPLQLAIKVKALPTGYAIYDYETRQQIIDSMYTQRFNELINITIRYYDSANQDDLYGATMTYEWLMLGPTQFYADPVYDGFYTFTLNTSDALTTGMYFIIINIILENHTTQQFPITLRVLERQTTLNNKTGLLYFSKSIWAGISYNFTFEYRDYLTKEKLSNLDLNIYSWQKLNATGAPIPGESGVGTLIEDIHKNYTLDFDTENRNVGYYQLYITIQKDNYEKRYAFIFLIIKRRPTSINGVGSNISISKNLIFRTAYNFTFEFNDTLLNGRIEDSDQAYYNWYKIDEDGNPTGLSGNIDLIKTIDNYYILDFNTSDRSVGTYLIFVFFQKDNYEHRNVTIILTISHPASLNDDENDDKKDVEEEFNIFIVLTVIGSVSIVSLIGIYSVKRGILQRG